MKNKKVTDFVNKRLEIAATLTITTIIQNNTNCMCNIGRHIKKLDKKYCIINRLEPPNL